MIFNSLKEKCEYYRSLTDHRLLPNTYTLVMIDGKNFSSLIKNKFQKPFDDLFIDTMNQTAIHLCKNVQNIVGAFVQSDEISLIIKDNSLTSMPYDGRLCKLLSIIPSTATSFFTKKMIERTLIGMPNDKDAFMKVLGTMKDYVFDCKVWTVPSQNDTMAWFLYRQIDCIRNSKQQFTQTYVPHKELCNLHTDDQVKLCLEKSGNDWNTITDDKKYGRFIFKELKDLVTEDGTPYQRNIWSITSLQLTNEENRNKLKTLWQL